jgi:hypothetical protein
MDFIECIFAISPNRGSGLFEWLLLLMPLVVIADFVHTPKWTRAAL